MFMPTHTLYVICKDGSRENIMMADFSTKKEIRKEVKSYIQMLIKHNKTSYENWVGIEYCDRNENVLYQCSMDEIMGE